MSTDAVDFRAAIGTHFNTTWAGATPIAWPGRDFEPPTDESSWVRLTITESDTRQFEIGNPNSYFREIGLIIVQVFTAMNKGDGPALTLGDQVADVFRRQQVAYTDGRVLFRAPKVRVIGPEVNVVGAEGAGASWFQVNVSIPYVRDTWHAGA